MNRLKAALEAFKAPQIVETYPALANHYLSKGPVTIPIIEMDDSRLYDPDELEQWRKLPLETRIAILEGDEAVEAIPAMEALLAGTTAVNAVLAGTDHAWHDREEDQDV